ncbi:MAG: hypothetical protein JOZ93_16960 [Sinobacteraceae bacterium]|nr:hypothetical protein [Nevskiaceae bacterium]
MRLLSRFLLWQKLLLVVVALILPAAILGVIWAHEEDAQVAQAQQAQSLRALLERYRVAGAVSSPERALACDS